MPDPKKQERPDADDKTGETAAEDQRARRYYYDDAHGYEEYDPGKDEDTDEEAD